MVEATFDRPHILHANGYGEADEPMADGTEIALENGSATCADLAGRLNCRPAPRSGPRAGLGERCLGRFVRSHAPPSFGPMATCQARSRGVCSGPLEETEGCQERASALFKEALCRDF